MSPLTSPSIGRLPPSKRGCAREAIIQAAVTLFDGRTARGLNLTQVALKAGVNRTTLMAHFSDRTLLIDTLLDRVSGQLVETVFGDAPIERDGDVALLLERSAACVMESPWVGRAWIAGIMTVPKRALVDPFWKRVLNTFRTYADSADAQPAIDVEAHALVDVTVAFLWLILGCDHSDDAASRRASIARFRDGILRLWLHGTKPAAPNGHRVGE